MLYLIKERLFEINSFKYYTIILSLFRIPRGTEKLDMGCFPKFLLLNLLLTLTTTTNANSNCPSKCICAGTTVSCNNKFHNSIPDGIPLNTTKLYLGSNFLTRIKRSDFSELRKLEELSLSSNFITTIEDYSFENLVNLKTLSMIDLRMNKITEHTFHGLINLESLSMNKFSARTEPTCIADSAFSSLTKLTSLRMRENQLKAITDRTFSGLQSLIFLDLSFNPIESISKGAFSDSPKTLFVNLESNKKLNCCCNAVEAIKSVSSANGICLSKDNSEIDIKNAQCWNDFDGCQDMYISTCQKHQGVKSSVFDILPSSSSVKIQDESTKTKEVEYQTSISKTDLHLRQTSVTLSTNQVIEISSTKTVETSTTMLEPTMHINSRESTTVYKIMSSRSEQMNHTQGPEQPYPTTTVSINTERTTAMTGSVSTYPIMSSRSEQMNHTQGPDQPTLSTKSASVNTKQSTTTLLVSSQPPVTSIHITTEAVAKASPTLTTTIINKSPDKRQTRISQSPTLETTVINKLPDKSQTRISQSVETISISPSQATTSAVTKTPSLKNNTQAVNRAKSKKSDDKDWIIGGVFIGVGVILIIAIAVAFYKKNGS